MISKKIRVALTVIPMSLVMVFSGCTDSETSEDPAPVTADYASLYTNVFSGCNAGGNCHTSTTNPEGGPSFPDNDAAEFHALVVGIKASAYEWDVADGCGEELLINESNASSSLIVGVLIEDYANNYPGDCVPNYSAHVNEYPALDGTTSEALVQWINNGASQ